MVIDIQWPLSVLDQGALSTYLVSYAGYGRYTGTQYYRGWGWPPIFMAQSGFGDMVTLPPLLHRCDFIFIRSEIYNPVSGYKAAISQVAYSSPGSDDIDASGDDPDTARRRSYC